MPKLYNLARMTSATTGTGTLTLGVAVSGYLSFATAGVQNGDIVFYGIKDGANSEVGWGTYTSAGTTLGRNVVKSTNSNAPISCSGAEEVYITALASDGGDLLPGFDHPMRGFDLPVNLQLNASVASNILTVAVKGNNGADPSNANPVLIPFRDPTIANGGPVWRAVTGALSINTNAVGATLGSANGVPFRFWVVAFDNAGTVVLALWQSVTGGATPTAIAPLNEAAPANTTGISATATAAGTFYTPNGTALTGKSFRILGYLDYASGLATAGTYASAPTTAQLFCPSVKLPGEEVQRVQFLTTTATNVTTSSFTATSCTANITPSAAPNLVDFSFAAPANTGATGAGWVAQMFRGATGVGPNVGARASDASIASAVSFASCPPWLDAPGTTSTTTYTVKARTNGTSSTSVGSFDGGVNMFMILREIMV